MRIRFTRHFFKNLRRNGRRKLVVIAGILVLHAVVIYGFVNVQPKNIHQPLLVYTAIVTDPSIIPYTFFEATQNPKCVEFQNPQAEHAAPLPDCTKPLAPPEGYLQLGQEGFIQLDLTLNAEGKVAQALLSQPSQFPALEAAAIHHIQSTWTFPPCTPTETHSCKHRIKFRWQNPLPPSAT